MLPLASKQSSLRFPLNEVFGSRGQVRLLRVLAAEARRPLLPGEAAVRAGMTESGARKVLQRLVRTGLVERTGNGTKNRFVFCQEGALATEVARLFQVERERGDALSHAIGKTVRTLPFPPKIAWVQDFLAGWTDCQEVGVFWGEPRQGEWGNELTRRLVKVEEAFEVALEVRIFSRPDLADVKWPRAVMLVGSPPTTGPENLPLESQDRSSRESPFTGNGKLNPESPEFSGALVALLEENLSVLRRARENVRGRLSQPHNGSGPDLWEWQKILDTYPFPRLLHFLESDSPRAVRLRECSPFPAVLSEEEKARLTELAVRPH